MEIDSKAIIQRVEEMYRYYEVDLAFLETLDDEQKMKGLKGVLAELDLKKKVSYAPDDMSFIKQIYSLLC